MGSGSSLSSHKRARRARASSRLKSSKLRHSQVSRGKQSLTSSTSSVILSDSFDCNKGLHSLRLTAPFSEPIHHSSSFAFPFHLTSLSFKGTYDSYPTALLDALVTSSLSSIASLDLDVYGSQSSASRFYSALSPISSRLRQIEIHGSSDRASPALLIFLTGCTSLKSFTCWEASPSLFSSLCPTVETLTICKTYVFHNDLLYDSLLTQSGILDHIKLIRWSGISQASLKAQRGGLELISDLQEKGIKMEFGAVSHGHWYGLGLRY